MDIRQQALIERAFRELERRHQKQRDSLVDFIQYYFEHEKKQELVMNWHIIEIANRLEKVYNWEIKRLIINIPPRALKTELVSKCFPVWCLWKNNQLKFINISYSTDLSQSYSWEARDYYKSSTYKKIFPRSKPLKEDKNTRQHRETQDWWQYYATWSKGTITWIWADIIIIDDPLKPKDWESDLERTAVNNNYHNTIKSRLNKPSEWAIIIIMQRVHDDDLCWHLLELQRQWLWEEREVLKIPAIMEEYNWYADIWESFFEKRFPLEYLKNMQKSDPVNFSCQYLQNPIAKESQEFHEEWFKYEPYPWKWRIFTAVDPAFSKKDKADFSSIITWAFIDDRMYILEYTVWRYDPWELQDHIIYHIKKRNPEKVWIESFQAQAIISYWLKNHLQKANIYCNIEEIRQHSEKEAKIRRLIPLYRNWLIYHKPWMSELESQLLKFPRWAHDDIIDSLQMLYNLYELQPNTKTNNFNLNIEYDYLWRPVMSNIYNNNMI